MYTTQLTPDQIAQARAFINNQYAPYTFGPDSGAATGRNTWNFNGDFNPYAVASNDIAGISGGQMAMGISDPNMAQILGMDPADYSAWIGSQSPTSLSYNAQTFAHDNPSLADPMMMQVANGFTSGATTPATPSTPSGGGGMGGGSNPYLGGMADAMATKWTNTLNDQWLPAIRDNAVASGGLGGSRQGVAQGLAIGRAGEGYAGQLANLYGGAWENQQRRGLEQQSLDNSFYSDQRRLDQSQFGLGLEAYNLGMNGPWTGLNNAGSIYGGVGNQNGSSTGNVSGGGGAQGALGGGLLGWGLWNQMNKAGG